MHQCVLIQVKHNFFTRINLNDIFFIESEGHYARLTTIDKSYLLNVTLTQLEADLPADLFCRVHRTYIVQIFRIININDNLIHLDIRDIPLSKSYRENLFARMKVFR